MRIVIVGAGLGGLSAALCFKRRGHQVTVVEQRPTFSPVGGGINIRPGASRIMHTWGLRPDLESISDATSSFDIRSLETGNITTRNVLTDVSDEVDWGSNREFVMQVLYKHACQAGVEILFGVSVIGVEESESRAILTCKGAKSLNADLVLAADGLKSKIRPIILSDYEGPIDPIISKATLYEAKGISVDELKSRRDTKRLLDTERVRLWLGRDCFVATRYSEKLGQFRGLFGIKFDDDMKGLWEQRGDIDYVRKFFANAGACEDLRAVLQLAKGCERWKVTELPSLPRWTSKGGRIVLLGDSAHAMHPNAGQGFSTIIEDIGVLDYLITIASDTIDKLPTITATWQEIRKPRVERIKDYAKENTAVYFGEPIPDRYRHQGDGSGVRSLKNIKPNMNAKFTSPSFVKWCYDYDAVAEAKRYLEHGHRPKL